MIKEILIEHQIKNKLYNSYLIKTDDIGKALLEVKSFAIEKLLKYNNTGSEGDYIIVKPKTDIIAIDQIRELQFFLYKSSVLSGKKVVIINDVARLTEYAANSCLKILEDTPRNSYLFLLALSNANILSTIESRCLKIDYQYNNVINIGVADEYIKGLLESTPITERMQFIKEYGAKNKELWYKFSSNAINLASRLYKKTINTKIVLSKLENDLYNQLATHSTFSLYNKYIKIKQLVDETIKFDLDQQVSCLLIIDQLKK